MCCLLEICPVLLCLCPDVNTGWIPEVPWGYTRALNLV